MIAYYWPPAGGVAPMRWLRMTHYLAENGFDITVMTPSNGSFAYYDASLEQKVHPNIKVIKTYSLEPLQWYQSLRNKKGQPMPLAEFNDKKNGSIFSKFSLWLRANIFIPDARIGWVPFAYRRASQEFKTSDFDIIITTGPPQSAHLIGLLLKKKFNVRWIADFRDPWTEIFYYDQLPHLYFVKKIDKNLEDNVIRNADVITTVGYKMAELFASRAKRVEVIYNGFDGEVTKVEKLKNKDTFKFYHIGSFLNDYPIETFLICVKKIIEKYPKIKVEINFVGNNTSYLQKVIRDIGVENNCVFHGILNKTGLKAHYLQADCLIFILANSKDNQRLISGKIFEYLKYSTPIISLGPIDGEANDILLKIGHVPTSNYYDSISIDKNLAILINNYIDGVQNHYDEKEIKLYSGEQLSRKIIKILMNE